MNFMQAKAAEPSRNQPAIIVENEPEEIIENTTTAKAKGLLMSWYGVHICACSLLICFMR